MSRTIKASEFKARCLALMIISPIDVEWDVLK